MNAPALSMPAGGSQKQIGQPFGVRACAVVRCPLANIGEFRQKLGSPGGQPFPTAFLKPADEQTIVAVAAVVQAAAQPGLERVTFGDWGVIAAPRFLGRINATDTIYKFETGGAWKAPPLFSAHRSLHAVSGTISQALSSKGPNFGVGGGLNAPAEGLLTALTMLDEYRLPGLWVVLTQCDPEPRPDHKGVNTVPVVCHAVALAFTPVAADWRGLSLRLIEAGTSDVGRQHSVGGFKERAGVFSSLARFLEQGNGNRHFGTWTCALKWGCELHLTDE